MTGDPENFEPGGTLTATQSDEFPEKAMRHGGGPKTVTAITDRLYEELQRLCPTWQDRWKQVFKDPNAIPGKKQT